MRHYGMIKGVYDLNHDWKFIEADLSVLPEGREHNDIYNFAKAGGKKGPAQSSFHDSDWKLVNLPHDWVVMHPFEQNEMGNHGYKKRGKGWYRRQFVLKEEDRNKQILLEFEGISGDARIYFNGQLLYRSFSSYQAFSVDITDMAEFGDVPNTLAVEIDASAWEGWWYEGAGIYRPVWLWIRDSVHVSWQGQWICPERKDRENWIIHTETELENSFESPKEIKVCLEIFDQQDNLLKCETRNVCIPAFNRLKVEIDIPVENPNLWSPEDPVLYKCCTIITNGKDIKEKLDYQTIEFGFRTIHVAPDTGFWLNDHNRVLKGFCNHQDHMGLGVAVPYDIKEMRIKKLKEIGADAIRGGHHPDTEILEICDRLGMVVIEENRTFSTSEENLCRLKQFVKCARNHPSVCFYSIFNEEPLQGTEKGKRMARRMKQVVKELDATRPVMAAFNGGYMEEQGAATVLDVVGINYNQSAYGAFHKKYPDIPIIASETSSAFSVRGEYNRDDIMHICSSLDEDFAPWGASARETWKRILEKKYIVGNFVWTGFDYRGEPTPFTWPSVGSFFGIFDSCGFRKAASYLYEAFYSKKPMIHIEPHWSFDVSRGTKVRISVISNCEEVVLYINSEKIDSKKVETCDITTFDVPFEPGTLSAEGYIGDVKVCENSVRTVSKAVSLQITCSKDYMIENSMDAVAVDICALDEKGDLVLSENSMVRFELIGEAKILGVGNGNPNSRERDLADRRKLFHGRAQVIIGHHGKGPVRFRAVCDGMEKQEILIQTKKEKVIPRIAAISHCQIDGWGIYHTLFDDMPDPNPTIDANNMNSFEPISFEGFPQAQLFGAYGKYALYRTKWQFENAEQQSIFFGNIQGQAWVYQNGNLIGEKTKQEEGCLTVNIKKINKHDVLSVIIRNMDKDWQKAGILLPVFCRNRE